jgi:hypothetical protein
MVLLNSELSGFNMDSLALMDEYRLRSM